MSEQQSLTDEFNTTAGRYMKGDVVSLDVLLLKYATLQRYKLDDAAGKRETTETLYRCAIDMFKRISGVEASNRVNINENLRDSIKRIYDTILEEGQAVNIPTTAPQEISSIALQLLRRTENVDKNNFLNWNKGVEYAKIDAYRASATAFAAFTLQCADRLREALKGTTGNVTTSQPVAPSRPIQLKQGAGAPSA